MEKLHEKCGIFGIQSDDAFDTAAQYCYGLNALQRRGQESAGIAVNEWGLLRCYKDAGLVNDVFTPEAMAALGRGNMAPGHVRYGATGVNLRQNTQPVVVNHVKRMTAR